MEEVFVIKTKHYEFKLRKESIFVEVIECKALSDGIITSGHSRAKVSTLLFGVIDLAAWNAASTIWRKEPENVTFLGVSYKANPAKVNKVKSLFKNVVEYNELASLSYNNEVLKQATNHVIVPPSDFSSDHIIGEGLYQQYLVRKNCGKTTEIYIEDRNIILPIKQVYKLQTSDMTKSALVIY